MNYIILDSRYIKVDSFDDMLTKLKVTDTNSVKSLLSTTALAGSFSAIKINIISTKIIISKVDKCVILINSSVIKVQLDKLPDKFLLARTQSSKGQPNSKYTVLELIYSDKNADYINLSTGEKTSVDGNSNVDNYQQVIIPYKKTGLGSLKLPNNVYNIYKRIGDIYYIINLKSDTVEVRDTQSKNLLDTQKLSPILSVFTHSDSSSYIITTSGIVHLESLTYINNFNSEDSQLIEQSDTFSIRIIDVVSTKISTIRLDAKDDDSLELFTNPDNTPIHSIDVGTTRIWDRVCQRWIDRYKGTSLEVLIGKYILSPLFKFSGDKSLVARINETISKLPSDKSKEGNILVRSQDGGLQDSGKKIVDITPKEITWDNILNKPNSFITKWSDISNKPDIQIASWDKILDKPDIALSDNVYSKIQTDEFIKNINKQLSLTSESVLEIDNKLSQHVLDLEISTDTKFQILSRYLRHNNADKLEIGEVNSQTSISISNSQMKVTQNGTDHINLENGKLLVPAINVTNSLKVGEFAIMIRSNGNICIKKVGDE